MSVVDSVVTGLNKLIDNRQVTTVIVSAALVGVGGLVYRLFDRYVRHRRAVSVTTIFDQAVNMATPNVTISAAGQPGVGGTVSSIAILRIANSGTEKIALKSKDGNDRFRVVFPGREIRAIKVRQPEELAGEPGRPLKADRFDSFHKRITTDTCLPADAQGNRDLSTLTVPDNVVLDRREAFQLAVFLFGAPKDPRERVVVRGELVRGGRIIHQRNSRWRRYWLVALPNLLVAAVAISFGVGALTAHRALTPQASCVGDLSLNAEGSTAFAHVVTEAATDYEQLCPASRITITANGSDAAISNHRGSLPKDAVLMVDYSGQAVPGNWVPNPVGMIIYGVVANRDYATAVAGTPYALRNGYGTADLANLYQVASTGGSVPFIAVGRNGASGTAAEFDSWTGLGSAVLTKAPGCPNISATATTPGRARTGICVVGSTQKMLDFVNDNANAIGFADVDEVNEYPNVTLLPIGGSPNQADVLNGTYTFAVPEYLYTSDSPSPQVSAFLSFLRSPAETAQLAAQDQGFIPCANLKGAVAGDCAQRLR
jgi:ABC-type phosphate transport system substrate-binding protein